MILESRKWRLLIRLSTLVLTSMLMLWFAGPVTYALQDDTPTTLTTPFQLHDKTKPLEGTYVDAWGALTLHQAHTTREFVTTYYWIPVGGYENQLIIRTDDPQYLFPTDYDPMHGFVGGSPRLEYTGKIMPLKSQPNADKLIEEWAAMGLKVDKEKAMVLSQGEVPSAFRPIVPIMFVPVWLWVAALIGLIQIIWGRRIPRHKLARASAPSV